MNVNLGSKKCENNNNSTCQLNHPQNLLLMSIVDTPEKDVSNVDSKVYKRTIRAYSIKSLSNLFSCSIRDIYNRVHCGKNKLLMLKSYIPAINESVFCKKHYENIFSEKISMNYMPELKTTLM